MYKDNIEFYKTKANIIKAIAHPVRLFIIEKIKEKEYSVGELSKITGYDTSTISKHLSILKNAGLIYYEKRGLNVYYKLKTPCILDMLTCVNKTIKQVAENNLRDLNK